MNEKHVDYPLIGDLFGWLAIAGFALVAAWAIVRGCREATIAAEEGALKPA